MQGRQARKHDEMTEYVGNKQKHEEVSARKKFNLQITYPESG